MAELTNNELLREFQKMFNSLESELKSQINSLEKRMDSLESELKSQINSLEKRMDSLESEIKIVKLTQNYIRETGNTVLEKPLDSISLASFLADEKEENSYFKLFR